MLYQNAEIVPSAVQPRRQCTVNAQTRLADLAHEQLNSPHAYLVVADEQGQPIGVVGVEEIRRRLDSPNFIERRRWMNMPIEATLNGRICSGPVSSQKGAVEGSLRTGDCMAISRDGSLVALVTDEDVLVSWRSIEQLIRQTQSDHVTGLPLRSAFDSALRAECARASRNHHSVAVILIDVDRFKEINDQYGHAAGDSVLSAVGRTLRSTLRSYDMVARYGGDEFAVLCCGCRPNEINITIRRLREGMEKLQADVSIPRPIPTLSIGACVVHDPNAIECPDQILVTADECLYFAKRGGRNRSFSTELGVESAVTC